MLTTNIILSELKESAQGSVEFDVLEQHIKENLHRFERKQNPQLNRGIRGELYKTRGAMLLSDYLFEQGLQFNLNHEGGFEFLSVKIFSENSTIGYLTINIFILDDDVIFPKRFIDPLTLEIRASDIEDYSPKFVMDMEMSKFDKTFDDLIIGSLNTQIELGLF